MFTDIVGFSGIAAAPEPPTKLAALLNRHFALLGAVIEEQGGTIDKYIGDSIMAFWGAPLDQGDHAERGMRAAVGIAKRLQADNARRAAEGPEADPHPHGAASGARRWSAISGHRAASTTPWSATR